MIKKIKKHKPEISVFNIILFMVVILVHLLSKHRMEMQAFPESLFYKLFMVMNRLTTFVVQAFIFLSAMKTFLNDRREPYGKYAVKRIRTVVIPYIIAVLIYYIYLVHFLEWFEPSPRDFLGYLGRGDIAAQFYFIIIIVQFYALYPLWRLILDRMNPRAAIGVSVVVTAVLGWYAPFIINGLFGIDDVPWLDRLFTTYLVYWIGGMYAGKYYDRFIGIVKKYGKSAVVALILLAILDSALVFLRYAGRIKPYHLDTVHALYCTAGIIAGMYISFALRNHMNGLMKVLDKSSYYIYLVHVLFIYILDYSVTAYHVASTSLDFLARAVIIYAAVIVFAYICWFIEKGAAAVCRKAAKNG